MFFQEYIPYYKRNLKVAIPIMLSQLGSGIVQLADTIMVGRLGTTELAAASFANSVFVIAMVFSTGLMMGLTPLVGIAFVEKDYKRQIQLFQNSFLVATITSFAIGTMFLCITPFLSFMGQETDVVTLAKPYYLTLVASLIPLLFFCSFKQFFEGIGNTKIAMAITIFSNVLNIVLNYLLIFGKCGFPQLGVWGAGIATFISRLYMPILFYGYIRIKSCWNNYLRSFSSKYFSRKTLKKLLSVGMPIGLQMILEVSAFAIACIMAGWISAPSMAGHQIAQTVSVMTWMIVIGIASATTIRVSHQYGIHDFHAVRMAVKASMHICLLWNALAAAMIVIFRQEIVMLFTTDPIVISIASTLLVFVAIYQLSDGLQSVGMGALRGLTDVKITILIAFISYDVITLPIAYILSFPLQFGVNGIWYAFIVGLFIAAILLISRFNWLVRKLEKSNSK